MNVKTTLVLAVVLALGGVAWVVYVLAQPTDTATKPVAVLPDELTRTQLQRIEVGGERPVVLERNTAGEWTLPGNWPTRKAEVDQLVDRLTQLRSRFVPLPITGKDGLSPYGLDKPTLTVKVRTGAGEHTLQFGEEPTHQGDRFARPTYLRVDEHNEVIRLTPELLGELQHLPDYYMQRRLFPAERVKDKDAPEAAERVIASALSAKQDKAPDAKAPADQTKPATEPSPEATSYSLVRNGDEWQLRQPYHDLPDPDQLKKILSAVPDIWAEQFVEKPEKDLAAYGLKEPEDTLTVTRPDGTTLTLLIGKLSPREERRMITPPAPPAFGQPQPPPMPQLVVEKFRYAKLANNDQVFEIKDAKLKDVFVAVRDLRDPQLARFRTPDARRMELHEGSQDLVFVKDKDHWKLEKPITGDAEASKVDELLNKLNSLQARDQDVIEKADPKTYGLDSPTATVKVVVEETNKDDKGESNKKTRTFTFVLGKQDAAKGKQYVQVEGRDRVNAVETGLMALVSRPALTYRGRRVLDFATTDVDQIDVQRGTEKFALKQTNGDWRLASPVSAPVEIGKVLRFAGDLSHLEAVEYVNDAPKPEELEQTYGLAKPALSATITFAKKETPARTLEVGKQRGDKPEYFAKLAGSPQVFVVKKELRDTLDQDSLAYRPPEVWRLKPGEVTEVQVTREGQPYRLKHEGASWKITEPFQAAAMPSAVDPIVNELTTLRSERYVAHTAADLGKYGLDKPHLRLAVTTEATKGAEPDKKDEPKDEKKEEKKDAQSHVLLIGQPTEKDAKTRFAKLGDSEAVFVVGDKLLSAVDHTVLDLLDRHLLHVDGLGVERIKSTGPSGPLTLQRDKDAWQVVESAAGVPFPADAAATTALLGTGTSLQAQRIAAYQPPAADLAKYGLDKPEVVVRLIEKTAGENAKPAEHTIALGKPVEGAAGERYARVDDGPAVAVLAALPVRELTRTYLDFVDRTVFKFDSRQLASLQCRKGADLVELTKRDDGWYLTKPNEQRADDASVQELVERLGSLRAERVAAYPAKDLKSFGLEEPAAVVTLKLAGSANPATEYVLKIGRPVDGQPAASAEDRYAMNQGGQAVVVLPGGLARHLLAGALGFRDRSLAHVAYVDRAVLERGSRKVVFSKEGAFWKMTEPVQTEAEASALDEFVRAASRLRADELVAEKPADLKTFGLDQPEAHWQLEMGGKAALDLLVGAPEKNGPRRYAKLAGGDLVFLLDAPLSEKALAEYRSRTVWAAAPDAAQAESLSYSRDGRPFLTLRKINNLWQVEGKPDVKVKADAVSDTLAALAGLRAARFVVDKGADLKLYGLQDHPLVVEVQTPTGKKTLHVGNHEGGSARYYAQVPEKDRSDVFVISEEDARRIVRELPAFAEK